MNLNDKIRNEVGPTFNKDRKRKRKRKRKQQKLSRRVNRGK